MAWTADEASPTQLLSNQTAGNADADMQVSQLPLSWSLFRAGEDVASRAGCPVAAFHRAAFAMLLARYAFDEGVQFASVLTDDEPRHNIVTCEVGPEHTWKQVAQEMDVQVAYDTGDLLPICFSDDQVTGQGSEIGLVLVACQEKPTLLLSYDANKFTASFAERLLAHYVNLLTAITANSECPLRDICFLEDGERALISETWKTRMASHPTDRCLHELISEAAVAHPDQSALVFAGQSLSYRELEDCASTLAASLVDEHGVAVGDFVGICMERSLELVIGLVAILKAGGAYVPMDPAYPRERLRHMLDDCGTSVLLTSDAVCRQVGLQADARCRVVTLAALQDSPAAAPQQYVNVTDHAYCIYTSGSTGKPKGVVIRHQSICNYLHWMKATYDYEPGERFLQLSTCSFDASVWEFFAPLVSGGTLVIAEPGTQKDFPKLVDTINDNAVNILQLVPSQLNVLVEMATFSDCQSLRLVFSGGEALSTAAVARFHEVSHAELHNLYGPTEVTIDATAYHCERGKTYSRPVVPIGFPLDNTRLYIVDRCEQPVPVGVPGELLVGGVQIAAGYHNRPELTAARFIADPDAEDAIARLYRTGDLCCWRDDGSVDYIRRIDEQVKVRGFRIELGEIEACLVAHPDLKHAAVLVNDVGVNDNRLVACLVCEGTHVPERLYLREYLKERIPDYMIPSSFVFVESLPLLPNGKIDRRKLRAIDEHTADEPPLEPPRTQTEIQLAEIWQRVLGVSAVGADANFFLLGGHSLLAVRLLGEVTKAFAVTLPLTQLQESPTLSAMAGLIEREVAAAAKAEAEELEALLAEIEGMDDAEVCDALKQDK